MAMSKVSVRVVDWQRNAALREIRHAVFVQEQQVPIELEWDEYDSVATHFMLMLEDEQQPATAIGTARLLPEGSIGRVAILPPYRGLGYGRVLMLEVMAHAQQQGMSRLTLSAQTHALDFYLRLGFRICSGEYMDAGIPHQDMHWNADEEGGPNPSS